MNEHSQKIYVIIFQPNHGAPYLWQAGGYFCCEAAALRAAAAQNNSPAGHYGSCVVVSLAANNG